MRQRIEIPRTAFPLAWPAGVARTRHRESARFHGTTTKTNEYTDAQGVKRTSSYKCKTTLTVAAARDDLLGELTRLNAHEPVVISSNLRTRIDGLPMSNQIEPADPGVAVYFMLNRTETCIAIDRFDRVADNLRAVAKTIEAFRGIERWGGASLVAAAFTGFQALPAPDAASWWVTLGVAEDSDLDVINAAALKLIAEAHPDRGGAAARFDELVKARNSGRAARMGVVVGR